jgi:hypothetical protein
MSGSAAIGVGLVAVFVWVASRDIIDSPLLRGALAASVVLVPVARIESLSNVSNLHFYLVFAAFWALLWRPQRPSGVALCSVVVAAAALSDPLTVLLAPVAAIRWLRAPDLAGRLPVMVWAIALALHGVVILISGVETTTGSPTTPQPIAIALLYPLRVMGGAVLGIQRTWELWEPVGPWLILAGGLGVAALIVLVATRLDDGRRVVAATALGLSAVYFVVALWIRWEPGLAPAADDGFLRDAVRYLLLPVLFLYAAMAIGLDGLVRRGGRASTATVGIVGVLVVSAWLIDFSGPNARSASPSWQASAAEARAMCVDGSTAEVTIPIAPATWTMRLPCEILAPAER